jgi:uncharacterized protein YdeI (YjbR/CyaY-like superfamily)
VIGSRCELGSNGATVGPKPQAPPAVALIAATVNAQDQTPPSRRQAPRRYSGSRASRTEEVVVNPKVDAFLKRQDKWRAEFEKLREMLLNSGLTEDLKWGQPCYAYEGKNVTLIHGFKEYCAILFHKGALLKDPNGVLIQQTKNVQAARQIRFTSVQEVARLEKTVKAYVREAIEIERAGLKVQFKKTEDIELPEEFESKLAGNAKLKAAFTALTPGRQRAYIFHFAQPKLSKTRVARVEKHIPRILKGLGLDD